MSLPDMSAYERYQIHERAELDVIAHESAPLPWWRRVLARMGGRR